MIRNKPNTFYQSNLIKKNKSISAISYFNSTREYTPKKCRLFCMLQQNKSKMRKTCENRFRKKEQSLCKLMTFQARQKDMQFHQMRKLIRFTNPNNTKNVLKLATQKKIMFNSNFTKNKGISIRQLQNICYDSTFPFYRVGSSLVSDDNQIYLCGGFTGTNNKNIAPIHKYDNNLKYWKQLAGQIKWQSSCFHTVQNFKQYLFFIGGYYVDKQNRSRLYNNDISILNTRTFQWSKFYFSEKIRAHASLRIGNVLIIHGGINQKQKYSNLLHLILLNYNNIETSVKITLQQPLQNSVPIAYHKILSTYGLSSAISAKLEGLLKFGGLDDNGNYSNEIEIKYLQISQLYKFQRNLSQQWKKVDILGQKPAPRAMHCFNIFPKKYICVLFGGKNDKGVLNDLWILDLRLKSWTEVKTQQFYKGKRFISHCSAVKNSKMFIFGGSFTVEGRQPAFLQIQTDQQKINPNEILKF